ncbi:MAG: Uma2 family endonuclease [Anaerolineae bacterium]|nr:Uma2 family endonuclease [Anaerolineae bacterium]
MAVQTSTRMTAAEFEALPESSFPTELIEGELVVRGVPIVNHQRAVLNTAALLRGIVPNGEVFVAPVSVRFNDANYFQPDVLWVAADGACEITRDGLNGAPDLVVEVISPGTASTDRGHKFRTYQAHGVREYWIVEPELRFIEIWQLANGIFVQHGVYEADESLTSPLLGQTIALSTILPAEDQA